MKLRWRPLDSITTSIGVIVLGGVLVFATAGHAQPKHHKLTLVIGQHGSYEIYVTDNDGTNPINLSRSPADDLYPQWTPLGDKMVFVSNRDGFYELYVIDADGSHLTQLTHHRAMVTTPVIGYGDPVKIAFVSTRDGKQDIYLMDTNGKNERKLTDGKGVNYQASWSPNGKEILFVSTRDGNHEVYLMNSDGTHQQNLTHHPADDTSPRLSPSRLTPDRKQQFPTDRQQMIFISNRDGNREVHIMNLDGSNQQNLTNTPYGEEFPAWTTDGKRITFMTNRVGHNQLAMMDVDGSAPVILSPPDKDVCGHPVWMNGGETIGYYIIEDGGLKFYVVGSDGSYVLNFENASLAES